MSRGSLLGCGTYLEEGVERADKRIAEAEHGCICVCPGTQVGMVSEVFQRQGLFLDRVYLEASVSKREDQGSNTRD